jgi:hypothetical protein
MGTVLVTNFSVDKLTFDWVHDDGSDAEVEVSALPHGGIGADDKTILVVECSVCNAKASYPMSGGVIAQQLHRNHLEQDTLVNVQADATARGISTTDKTQAQLIAEIIQDECTKNGCSYLL